MKWNQATLYHSIIKPLIPIAYQIEQNGVRIDLSNRTEIKEELTDALIDVEKQIWKITGTQFNIASPSQLSVVLYDKLGFPVLARGKSTVKNPEGAPSTKEGVIRKLLERPEITKNPNKEILPLLAEYRNINKLIDTYVNGIKRFIHHDGKVHPSIFLTGTENGRWTIIDPPMQTIPKREDLVSKIKKRGAIIRKMFVPEKGYVFVELDEAQSELRIMGFYSEEPELINAAHNNLDLHSTVGAKIFKYDIDEWMKRLKDGDKYIKFLRTVTKNIEFGFLYLGRPEGLRNEIPALAEFSLKELREIFRDYFRNMPGVAKYQRAAIYQGIKKGYGENVYGRIRHVPRLKMLDGWDDDLINWIISGNFYTECKDKDKRQRYSIIRDVMKELLNYGISSTSVDFLNLGLIAVGRWLKESNFPAFAWNQIHDSVSFQVKETHLDEFIGEATRRFNKPKLPVTVPMLSEAEIGRENWLEMEEYEV